MKRWTGRIGVIFGLLSTFMFPVFLPQANASNVVYSAAFTQGAGASVSAMNGWETFRSQLTGSYNSFTWSSTNGQSITVTDATGVQTLANALRTATRTNVTIGANTWFVGTGCGSVAGYANSVEFSNVGSCSSSSTYALRPMIGTSNSNWGGTNEYTVNAPSQTITLTFFVNAPTPTTFSTLQSSPANISTSATISYSLVLSQSVSDLATGDFQLGGTSTCNTPGLSGSGTTYTVTLTNCSEGTVILQLKANAVTGPTTTGPSAVTSANTVIIDRTAPTILALSSFPTGTYYPGNTLTFNFQMSETVTVSGSPRVPLTVGSVTRFATYSSGSNSRLLSFVYTVATDIAEVDTDSIEMLSPMQANGGAITDLASNAMSVFTYTTPSLSLYVAQPPAAPTISSITPANAQLSVAFTAGDSRGSAITNYQYSTDNGSTWKVRASGTTASPIVITTVSASASSLANGTSYNVRIRAVNAAGNGDSSTAVSATPSAVVVSGDSTLTSTYGQAASTGTYTSTGGTGPYTYTLSASATGVSISSGVVTASASTPAGTYVRNVVSTDTAGTPQSGTRQLTITINKASTTITISLPGSASDAALGGAVTITANVSQAGAVNFRLGGTTISGCGTVASSGGTATCSWTPGALGGASLTAVLTPTDSNNYESATTSTLSITVVNGVTSLSLSLAGGVTQVPKGQNIVITATVDQAGRISFFVDGKRIAGCFNRVVATSSRTCTWKPSVQKQVTISSRLVPTNSAYSTADESMKVWVVRRTGTR
jgi:hypothetical protein